MPGLTRAAAAEDLAELVEVDFEELPAVADMQTARKKSAPLLHDHWEENAFLETGVDVDFEAAIAGAASVVKRSYRTARQCMAPIEGRGCVAEWDHQLEQLTVHTSTQMPHIVRTGLAECLGLDHGQVRIVAPDVGGGFGYKGVLLAEEVCVSFLAMQLDRPIRWIEDRREHLMGAANCREHAYEVNRLRGGGWGTAGSRLRGHRRFRCLFGLPIFSLPGGSTGHEHPARALSDARVSDVHSLGSGDQQAANSYHLEALRGPGSASPWNS